LTFNDVACVQAVKYKLISYFLLSSLFTDLRHITRG
jgi:hypothetical protein